MHGLQYFYDIPISNKITGIYATWAAAITWNQNSITIYGSFSNYIPSCTAQNYTFLLENIRKCSLAECWNSILYIQEHNLFTSNPFSATLFHHSANDVVNYAHTSTQLCILHSNNTIIYNYNQETLEFVPFHILNIKFETISSGLHHFVTLNAMGDVYTYGSNLHGQLGIGCISSGIHGWACNEALQGLRTTQIACGDLHTIFMTESADIYTCGSNAFGQLGHSNDSTLPNHAFELPYPLQNMSISAGSRHSIISDGNSNVYGCGWNKYNQLDKSNNLILDKFILIFVITSDFDVIAGSWVTCLIKH